MVIMHTKPLMPLVAESAPPVSESVTCNHSQFK